MIDCGLLRTHLNRGPLTHRSLRIREVHRIGIDCSFVFILRTFQVFTFQLMPMPLRVMTSDKACGIDFFLRLMALEARQARHQSQLRSRTFPRTRDHIDQRPSNNFLGCSVTNDLFTKDGMEALRFQELDKFITRIQTGIRVYSANHLRNRASS